MIVNRDVDDLGFFDESTEDLIPRDQYGRPRIIPPGETKRPRFGYTRASSVAGYLEDFFAIERWQKRRLVKGLSEREDLMAMVAALPPLTGDADADRETNRELDVVIAAGIERGGCYAKANWGTAIHRFTDPGARLDVVPERMRPDVEAYWRWLEDNRLEVVEHEIFVVDDERMIAGTFDGLYRCPDGAVRLGDKKTGRDKPLSLLVQLASYAGGERYNVDDTRSGRIVDHPDFDDRWGLHIQIREGRCEAKEVDLEAGRLFRDVAIEVRETRKQVQEYIRPMRDYAGEKRVEALGLIAGVTTLEEAQGLFETYRQVWNAELKAAMSAHIQKAGIRR